MRPDCVHSGSALVVIAAQLHGWTNLDQVEKTMTRAFDKTLLNGNYELAACESGQNAGADL